MPRDGEDDYEYTASDISPREPDRFEKASKHGDQETDDDRSHGGREQREQK